MKYKSSDSVTEASNDLKKLGKMLDEVTFERKMLVEVCYRLVSSRTEFESSQVQLESN